MTEHACLFQGFSRAVLYLEPSVTRRSALMLLQLAKHLHILSCPVSAHNPSVEDTNEPFLFSRAVKLV